MKKLVGMRFGRSFCGYFRLATGGFSIKVFLISTCAQHVGFEQLQFLTLNEPIPAEIAYNRLFYS